MSPGLALGSPWAHTEILGLTMQKQKFWAISEIADEVEYVIILSGYGT